MARGLRDSLKYSAVGIEVGLAVIVGLVLGQFADDFFGTEPWLTLVGMLFGVGAAIRSLIRAGRRMRREEPSKAEEKGPKR